MKSSMSLTKQLEVVKQRESLSVFLNVKFYSPFPGG